MRSSGYMELWVFFQHVWRDKIINVEKEPLMPSVQYGGGSVILRSRGTCQNALTLRND